MAISAWRPGPFWLVGARPDFYYNGDYVICVQVYELLDGGLFGRGDIFAASRPCRQADIAVGYFTAAGVGFRARLRTGSVGTFRPGPTAGTVGRSRSARPTPAATSFGAFGRNVQAISGLAKGRRR